MRHWPTKQYELHTAEGRVCCASDHAEDLCEHCAAALADQRTSDHATPPDPYRVAAAKPETVMTNGVPDGYRTALARKEAR